MIGSDSPDDKDDTSTMPGFLLESGIEPTLEL